MGSDVLAIDFPFAHAAYGGSSVTVSGSLNHADFAEMSVTAIAGDLRTPAFIDGRGRFLAPDVSLPPQATGASLQITASHPRHGSAQRTLRLSGDPDLASLIEIEIDAASDRIIAIDAMTALVIAINPTDGRREIVSGPFRGSGDALSEPIDLVLDTAGERAFVLDDDEDAVFEVDLLTGDRTILYELESFSGRIAFNALDGSVVLAEGFGSIFRLVAIDPASRTHTVLLDGRIDDAAQLPRATALALDMNYSRVILVNGNSGTVYGIDLSTGAARVISDRSFSPTPGGDGFVDIEIRDGMAYLVDRSGRSIIRVDLNTGRQEIVSNPATFQGERVGTGPLLLEPTALALDAANDRLIVADDFADALVAVQPQTGNRTMLAHGGVGDGIHFRFISGLAMREDPLRLYVVDPISDTGVEIDTHNGDRRLIFGTSNVDGSIDTAPSAIASDPARGVLYVADIVPDTLAEVDLAGGTPTVISGPARGSGPRFRNIIDIELEISSGTAYILDRLLDAVLAVDMDTGDRRIVSDATIGVGDRFRNPVGLELDFVNDRAFVADADSRTIHEISLLSGDRAVLSSPRVGSGAGIGWLGDIAYDSQNERLVAIDVGGRNLVSIDLGTGLREIVSGDASRLLGIEDPDGRLQLVHIPRLVGGGSMFTQPRKIELSADRAIAYVLDTGYDGVLAVELQKGDRQLISK